MRLHQVFLVPLKFPVFAIFVAALLLVSPSHAEDGHLEANLDKNAEVKGSAPWSYSLQVEPAAQQRLTYRDLKDRLDRNDFLAALKAMNVALDEVGDGSTFVWRRKNHGLKGAIKPFAAYQAADGRICRKMVFSLFLGGYEKSIKSVACRGSDGRWVAGS